MSKHTVNASIGETPRGLAANEVAAVCDGVSAYIKKKGLSRSWRGWNYSAAASARRKAAAC